MKDITTLIKDFRPRRVCNPSEEEQIVIDLMRGRKILPDLNHYDGYEEFDAKLID